MTRQEIEDHLRAAGFAKVTMSNWCGERVDIKLIDERSVRVEIYSEDNERVLSIIAPIDQFETYKNDQS